VTKLISTVCSRIKEVAHEEVADVEKSGKEAGAANRQPVDKKSHK
jgi:hypothetical protein